jgi:hypothetical protein
MSQSIFCKYRVCIAPSPPTSPLPTKTKLFQPTAPSFLLLRFQSFHLCLSSCQFLIPPFPSTIPPFPPTPPSPLPHPTCMTVCHVIMSVSCCHVMMSYNILQTKYDYIWIILIYKQLNNTT